MDLEETPPGPQGPRKTIAKKSTGPPRRRASRAGTRSVRNLTADQLERKRANDRDAQRAIRQRTKDTIQALQRSVHEMSGRQAASMSWVHMTQQRNASLEHEVAFLRDKLSSHAGFGSGRHDSTAFVLPPICEDLKTAGSAFPHRGSLTDAVERAMVPPSSNSYVVPWLHHPSLTTEATGTSILSGTDSMESSAPLTVWQPDRVEQEVETTIDDMGEGRNPCSLTRSEPMEWPYSAPQHEGLTSQQQRARYSTALGTNGSPSWGYMQYQPLQTGENDLPHLGSFTGTTMPVSSSGTSCALGMPTSPQQDVKHSPGSEHQFCQSYDDGAHGDAPSQFPQFTAA